MKIDVDLGDERRSLAGTSGGMAVAVGLVVRADRAPFVSVLAGGTLDGQALKEVCSVDFDGGEVCINFEIVEV